MEEAEARAREKMRSCNMVSVFHPGGGLTDWGGWNRGGDIGHGHHRPGHTSSANMVTPGCDTRTKHCTIFPDKPTQALK